jgi:hypothetical protein
VEVIELELPESDYEILKEIADIFMKRIEIKLWIMQLCALTNGGKGDSKRLRSDPVIFDYYADLCKIVLTIAHINA